MGGSNEVAIGRADEGGQNEQGATQLTRLGIAVKETEGAVEGLMITDVRGAAARMAGLHRGDVLLAIGNVSLSSVKALVAVLRQVPKGRSVALLIRRGEGASYVAVQLDEK